MRIGIFGGTFDPPHIGHLILASKACFTFQLDQVLWVVTSNPPHKQKQSITPVRYRMDMVTAALAAEPLFTLSWIDAERPAPQYVVDTMRILRERYPKEDLFYLMGGDSLHDLPTWQRPRQFLSYCTKLVVMRRPADEVNMDELKEAIPGIIEKILFISTPLIQIASHNIRESVKQSRPFRYYLPEAVYQIILEKKLYRD